MSNTWLIGCAHVGHRAINKYRDGINSMEENTAMICDFWKKHVKGELGTKLQKKDTVWCFGDMAFDPLHNRMIRELPGRKILLRGNHDDVSTAELSETYEEIHGIISRKKFWYSHAPIHPAELYDRVNVHAHVHEKTIIDERYINVSVDNLLLNFGQPMITIEQMRSMPEMFRNQTLKYGIHKDFAKPPEGPNARK